jgi:hypothetical protein
VLARGSAALRAEIEALGWKLPQKMQQQVLTAYAVTAGSKAPSVASNRRGKRGAEAGTAALQGNLLSIEQAAETLYQQLMQRNNQPSRAVILQLLCATGSPGPQPRAFDPALVPGFRELLKPPRELDIDKDGAPVWFAAALLQLQLCEQAKGDPILTDILDGSGALDDEYLRCVHTVCRHLLLSAACVRLVL